MTTQECYEAIRAYFTRKEAVLAKDPESISACSYRMNDGVLRGAKCAVGCLISDELYDAENAKSQIEGSKLNPGWLRRHSGVAELLIGVDLKFLRSAQVLHDEVASDARAFVAGLDILANAFGLEVSKAGAPLARRVDELLEGTVRQVEAVKLGRVRLGDQRPPSASAAEVEQLRARIAREALRAVRG